jgi:1,4-alpha-glucan branching enzyme
MKKTEPITPASQVKAVGKAIPAISAPIMRVQTGTHHDPFEVLGWHTSADGATILRAFMPPAEAIEVGGCRMTRVAGTDCFELTLAPGAAREPHPILHWQDKHAGAWHDERCAYTFAPQISDFDRYLLREGRHMQAWHVLGARLTTIDGIAGCEFAMWAPAVQRVSVIGDFNAWDGRRHPMRCLGDSGLWELFIPDLTAGEAYKYEILGAHGQLTKKPTRMRARCSRGPKPRARFRPNSSANGTTTPGSRRVPSSTGSINRSRFTNCTPVRGDATPTAASTVGTNSSGN